MAFTKSEELQKAEQALADWQASKPSEYKSNYQSQIDSLLDKIQNRESFSYNFNADPLYQQYRTQYQQAGKKASEDVQAQSAALSGGYGNSYASTVGNQQYQNYLSKLNDVIPTLQSAAYTRYNQEGTDLQNQLSALNTAENTAYTKYQNDLTDYYNNLSALTTAANTLYEREYQDYQNALAAAASSSSSGGSSKSSSNNESTYSIDDGIDDVIRAGKANTGGQMTSGVYYDVENYIKDLYANGAISSSTATSYLNKWVKAHGTAIGNTKYSNSLY